MTDPHAGRGPEETVDRELNLRGILWTGVGLALLLAVSAVLMWPLSDFFRDRSKAADPPPPLLPEARIQPQPPEPRLQTAPEADLRALRAEEDEQLSTWAWADRAEERARVPIERAIEILAAEGPGALDAAAPPPVPAAGEQEVIE